jgi:hypothetical protein
MHEEVAAGRATSVEDLQMFYARHLQREEVYATFGYSPILGDDGRTIEGVFCACTETTQRIIGVRWLATLRDLGARSPEQRSAELACRDAAEILIGNPLDIPFTAIYLLEEEGTSARRFAGTTLPDGSTVFPDNHPVHNGDAARAPWPLLGVVETQQYCQVSNLPSKVGAFPAGPWPDPVETAFVLPLAAPTQPRPAGFLIAGVSPRRILDADYRSFLDLVAGHIATSISEARAFEAERRRAESLAEIDRAKTTFFLQCKPRVPHTADAIDEPDRGSAGDARALIGCPAAPYPCAPQFPASAAIGQYTSGLLARRGWAISSEL